MGLARRGSPCPLNPIRRDGSKGGKRVLRLASTLFYRGEYTIPIPIPFHSAFNLFYSPFAPASCLHPHPRPQITDFKGFLLKLNFSFSPRVAPSCAYENWLKCTSLFPLSYPRLTPTLYFAKNYILIFAYTYSLPLSPLLLFSFFNWILQESLSA